MFQLVNDTVNEYQQIFTYLNLFTKPVRYEGFFFFDIFKLGYI